MGKYTYRQEWVKCGKAQCKRCPHGPYWYAYWSEKGKLHKRYIGKNLPHEDATQEEPPSRETIDPRDEIFRAGSCDLGLAATILGVSRDATFATVKAAYFKLALASHPDRGGDEHCFKLYAAAWEVFRRVKGERWSRA